MSDLLALRIQLFGDFRLWVGDQTIDTRRWRLRKARTLIKLLALAPTHRLHREQVMTRLWPDLSTEAAANNLHQVLHIARRALTAPAPRQRCLFIQDEFIHLWPDGPLTVDLETFEAATAAVRHSPDPLVYRRALALATDELLPDDRYDDWAADRRQAVIAAQIQLRLALAQILEAQDELAPALEALRPALNLDPALESAHVGLMRLLALLGERQKALNQFQELRAVLAHDLGIEPSAASVRLYEAIKAEQFPGAVSARRPAALEPPPRHRLPVLLTSFIGRQQELSDIQKLLVPNRADEKTGVRLLTLTGAGGSGKTRLALRVAQDLVEAFPDGIWFVDLAPVREPAQVVPACLGALGLVRLDDRPPAAILTDFLREKHGLLLLDNCEHLVPTLAPFVSALLRDCPNLVILATSREILATDGETAYRVPTLSTPQLHHWKVADLPGFDAVQLFVARARSAVNDFALTPENAADLVQICTCLDGIPLALELAAARVRVLSVGQIAARLDDRFRLLRSEQRTAVPRHRTLQALIDWSYDLLTDRERVHLRRLSVFSSGWTLEAAQDVCGEGDADGTLDALTQLVNKSLIVFHPEGIPRYRMPETLRQYASARLLESGETSAIQRRHLQHYLAWAEHAEPHLRGFGMVAWLDRLENELYNWRTALTTALERDPDAALRLSSSLLWFWHIRGHRSEGTDWLRRALAVADQQAQEGAPAPVRDLVRAKTLIAYGTMLYNAWDYDQARRVFEDARVLLEPLGVAGRRLLAYADLRLGSGAHTYASACDFLTRSLEVLRAEGDAFGVAESLLYFSVKAFVFGLYAEALRYGEQSQAAFESIGDLDGIAISLSQQGRASFCLRHYGRARSAFEACLESCRRVGNVWLYSHVCDYLGDVAFWSGDLDDARRIWTDALATATDIGDARLIAASHYDLALLDRATGDGWAAAPHLHTALDSFRALGFGFSVACCQHELGNLALAGGDHESARHWYDAEAMTAEERNVGLVKAFAAYGLGRCAFNSGALELARDHFELGQEACGPSLNDDPAARAAALLLWLGTSQVALARSDLRGVDVALETALQLRPSVGPSWYGIETHPVSLNAHLLEVCAQRLVFRASSCPAPAERTVACQHAVRLWAAGQRLHDRRYALSPAERDAHDRALAAAQSCLRPEQIDVAHAEGQGWDLDTALQLCRNTATP